MHCLCKTNGTYITWYLGYRFARMELNRQFDLLETFSLPESLRKFENLFKKGPIFLQSRKTYSELPSDISTMVQVLIRIICFVSLDLFLTFYPYLFQFSPSILFIRYSISISLFLFCLFHSCATYSKLPSDISTMVQPSSCSHRVKMNYCVREHIKYRAENIKIKDIIFAKIINRNNRVWTEKLIIF